MNVFALKVILIRLLLSLIETPTTSPDILSLSDRREVFVDHFLIDKLQNAVIKMHTPRDEGVVLYFDKPWEGAFSGYGTVILDRGVYRLYYRGVPVPGADGNDNEVTCYAESSDGIHWVKPDIGLYNVDGSPANNIVLKHVGPVTHNFSPFVDVNPLADPSQRYKALGGTEKSGLVAYVSSDGIHWKKMQEDPVFTEGMFDSQNTAFWSVAEQQYVCYFRTWTGDGYSGFRTISRTTSRDFIHWSTPSKMSFGDTPYEHLYTHQTSSYYRAPHIYVAIGARFMPNREVVSPEAAAKLQVDPNYYKDCSDAYFMTSRGGNTYERTFMESFVRPGIGLGNWVSRSNYPALNVVQTSDTEMSFYINEDYAQPTACLTRYSLRIDGFSSLSAGYNGGTVITKPFTFTGNELEINYSTSAAGEVRVEVLDEQGNSLPGFGANDVDPIIGNEIGRVVSWKGKTGLLGLSGRSVRLRIYLKDADLYSIKFNR